MNSTMFQFICLLLAVRYLLQRRKVARNFHVAPVSDDPPCGAGQNGRTHNRHNWRGRVVEGC